MNTLPGQSSPDGPRSALQRALWWTASTLWVLVLQARSARGPRLNTRSAVTDPEPRSETSTCTTAATAANALGGEHPNDVPGAPPRAGARTRVAVDCLLIALVPATIAVCRVQPHGTVRLLLVLTAACLLPGTALLTRLSSGDLLSAFGLAVALSLCIETIGALVMVWTGWWHPIGFSLLLAGLSCALLALDLWRNLASLNGGADD